MKTILGEIQRGEFAKEWILENKAGRPSFNALARQDDEHLIETVGKELRGMMSWVGNKAVQTAAEKATVAEKETNTARIDVK
jgi:ketol-acid reductoisomerase